MENLSYLLKINFLDFFLKIIFYYNYNTFKKRKQMALNAQVIFIFL